MTWRYENIPLYFHINTETGLVGIVLITFVFCGLEFDEIVGISNTHSHFKFRAYLLTKTLAVLHISKVMDFAVRHLPTRLQRPVRNLRLRSRSSSSSGSSSSHKTRLTIVNNNDSHRNSNKPSISPNPTPTASPRTSAIAQVGYSPGKDILGTHLTPGDGDSPYLHRKLHEEAEDENETSYMETTFTFDKEKSNKVQSDIV